MIIPIGAGLMGLQGLAKWARDFIMVMKGMETGSKLHSEGPIKKKVEN
jgi:hypothetical protein